MAEKIAFRQFLKIIVYVIMLILVIIFFTGKGTFIYEGF